MQPRADPVIATSNHMAGNHLFIRLDLSNGKHIGPGKIALLEAIRADGSILAASKHFGNV
jgi:molybdenum-dependent DNA-binding transcriptional regulator ModE